MKYYIADYRTYDGDHEYVEYSVMSGHTYETAERRAINDRKLFTRYGWGNFASLSISMKYQKPILRF
jgi:hypothetical protein